MSKKAITIIASEETYRNLSTFNDIDELNKTVRQYKEIHKLNKNTVRVLDLLHRYSAKYKGVSFRTKNNIANELKISRRTVIRACQTLESLGIIKQYEMKRNSDMQQTSNAIVIQPIVTQEEPTIRENCHSKKTTSRPLKQKINNNVRGDGNLVQGVKEMDTPLDYTFASSNIPKQFINVISPFYNSADSVTKLWSRLTLATRKSGVSGLLLPNIDVFLKVFKESIYRKKQNRIRGSFTGYLYKSWERTAYELDLKNNSRTGIFYDWLSE